MDLAERLQADEAYRLDGGDADHGEIILEGEFFASRFHAGLNVHTTNAVEQHDGTTEILLAPGLTISVLLEGEISGTLDGNAFCHRAAPQPIGCVWTLAHPTQLVRHIHKGERVRKVNVSIGPNWIAGLFAPDAARDPAFETLLTHHLSRSTWSPSEASLNSAEAILREVGDNSVAGRLSVEMRAFGIVREALTTLWAEGPTANEAAGSGDAEGNCTLKDAARARLAKAHIDAHLGNDLTLEEIAAAASMSVSTLQRIFRAQYGMTVIAYLRARRLDLARKLLSVDGLSIQQTAHQVGYTSAANFTTAFRRQFGFPPSRCMS